MTEKSRGGRPAIAVNPITAQRIKRLREQHRETQAALAEVAHCTKVTVARWEKGTRGIEDHVLQTLAGHWGVLLPYLTGETNIVSDPVAYRLEKESLNGFTAAVEEHEYNIRRTRLDNLFSLCGFAYRDSYDGALFHSLTDESSLISPATFDDSELDGLISKIHDLIELECYRKAAAQHK